MNLRTPISAPTHLPLLPLLPHRHQLIALALLKANSVPPLDHPKSNTPTPTTIQTPSPPTPTQSPNLVPIPISPSPSPNPSAPSYSSHPNSSPPKKPAQTMPKVPSPPPSPVSGAPSRPTPPLSLTTLDYPTSSDYTKRPTRMHRMS
jgi:hypothetical protein